MTTIMTSEQALREALRLTTENGDGALGDTFCEHLTDHPHTATLHQRRDALQRQAALAWSARCEGLSLRRGTKGRAAQLEAFLQGTLAVLTAGRYMSHEEAGRVAFLVSVDRGEELLARWESLQ